MGSNILSHEQLREVLNQYIDTNTLNIPADIDSIQRQKLVILTTIVPATLMLKETFIFTAFDDLHNPHKHLTQEALEEIMQNLTNSLADTNVLRSSSGIDESEQQTLAFLAVKSLESLAGWK